MDSITSRYLSLQIVSNGTVLVTSLKFSGAIGSLIVAIEVKWGTWSIFIGWGEVGQVWRGRYAGNNSVRASLLTPSGQALTLNNHIKT